MSSSVKVVQDEKESGLPDIKLLNLDQHTATSEVAMSASTCSSSGGLRSNFKGTWTYQGATEQTMLFQKFAISEKGSVSASGTDINGAFMVDGQVEQNLSFRGQKTYPDHCVYLWGTASIDESKLMMADWNKPVPLEEIDHFQGKWGFEIDNAEGTFQIILD